MSLGKPVRRREADSGCQWIAIGMSLGMGCSLVFCLISYLFGVIEIRGFEEVESTSPAQVNIVTAEITATPQQIAATMTPSTEVAAAPVTTEEVAQADPNLTPSATMLGSGASTPTRLPEVTEGQGSSNNSVTTAQQTSEIGTAFPTGGAPTDVPSIGTNSIPDELASLRTPLASVPGGSFTMGTTREEGLAAVDACVTRDGGNCEESYIQDATPAHQVTVDNFQIEIYEVSLTQFTAYLNYLASTAPAGTRADLIGCGGQPCMLTQADEANSLIRYNGTEYEIVNGSFNSNHPVTFVTWFGADAYCKAVGRRLPTEAEWERSARGPANSIYPWGPEWVPENANTSRSTSGGTGTAPVDSYPTGVSSYGVYNMAGNVSEWVADFYQENYYSLPESAGPNPKGPIAGLDRVARGGGWDNVPLFARTVHRLNIEPKQPRSSLGFRCAANENEQ